jgi:SOS response regulatory protein OraA/RecX
MLIPPPGADLPDPGRLRRSGDGPPDDPEADLPGPTRRERRSAEGSPGDREAAPSRRERRLADGPPGDREANLPGPTRRERRLVDGPPDDREVAPSRRERSFADGAGQGLFELGGEDREGRSGRRSASGGRAGGPATGRGDGRRGGRRRGAGRPDAGAAPGHPEDAVGDPESVARAICLRLLTLQPRTRSELAAALAKRGVPDEAAETVLGRFTEVGLIDDRAFAAAWVDSRHAGRGLARRALAAELRRRGVDREVVGEAVAVIDTEAEERAARQLVERRLPATRRLEQPARVRRLVGMLARKGYPPGLAMRVVREALAADGADPGDLDGLDDSGPDDA